MSSACNSGLFPSKSVNTDGYPVSRDSVKLVQWRESGVLNSFVVAGGRRGGTAPRSVWGKVNEDHKALWKTKGYLNTKQSSDLFMSGQRGIKIKLKSSLVYCNIGRNHSVGEGCQRPSSSAHFLLP